MDDFTFTLFDEMGLLDEGGGCEVGVGGLRLHIWVNSKRIFCSLSRLHDLLPP